MQGIVDSSSVGYAMEKTGEGRVLVEFGEYVKDFHTHVIFATNDGRDRAIPMRCGASLPAGSR